jgi:cytochrome c biogenesis protein CcdA/thiol-disulfide isomerase/thioredoxin
LAVGVLAGVVTGLSPCVLPVVPVLAAGGAVGGGRWRPVGIVAGMVLTFSFVTLIGSSLLSFLGLPQDLLRDLGIGVLFVLGASLLVPSLGYLVERPFARLSPSRVTSSHNGLLLGASLGLVFVPCAGPVLAAITVVGATHKIGLEATAVTVCYAIGAAIPLLVVVYLSRRATSRSRSLRRRAPLLRQAAGLLIIASAAVIAFGVAQPLQRDLPGYTTALDSRIEGSSSIASSLNRLSGEHSVTRVSSFGRGLPDASNPSFSDYGAAPRLLKITTWLNTPGDRPLSLASLKGKVVLVDFWTYSCINCERAIPQLEAWYRTYAPYGLVVIGVHTPEFAFERVIGNVRSAVRTLGVDYPVAIDDSYATWLSYGNEQWPTEYLIDQTGQLRYIKAGEGDYKQTEALIRDLLSAGGERLPRSTNTPNLTPTELTTPEAYLGFLSSGAYVGPHIVLSKPEMYTFAPDIPLNDVSLHGMWTSTDSDLVSGAGAQLRLHFQAKNVYLVLGGHGTLAVSLNGRRLESLEVHGYPRNYTIIKGSRLITGFLQVDMSPGISAYDFTFG